MYAMMQCKAKSENFTHILGYQNGAVTKVRWVYMAESANSLYCSVNMFRNKCFPKLLRLFSMFLSGIPWSHLLKKMVEVFRVILVSVLR